VLKSQSTATATAGDKMDVVFMLISFALLPSHLAVKVI